MKRQQIIPVVVLLVLVGALVALIVNRYEVSTEKNTWSELVTTAPVILDDSATALELAEEHLQSDESAPETEEITRLVESTRADAEAFGQILVYATDAPEVVEGPLEAAIDPFALGASMDVKELQAIIPSDFRAQLTKFSGLKDQLSVSLGELERATEGSSGNGS